MRENSAVVRRTNYLSPSDDRELDRELAGTEYFPNHKCNCFVHLGFFFKTYRISPRSWAFKEVTLQT